MQSQSASIFGEHVKLHPQGTEGVIAFSGIVWVKFCRMCDDMHVYDTIGDETVSVVGGKGGALWTERAHRLVRGFHHPACRGGEERAPPEHLVIEHRVLRN